jgi:hypothetical protein
MSSPPPEPNTVATTANSSATANAGGFDAEETNGHFVEPAKMTIAIFRCVKF